MAVMTAMIDSLIGKKVLKYKNKGDILDLGCGKGNASIFLAQNGFSVTSVDKSKESIDLLNNFCKENSLNIKTYVEDLKHCKFDKNYDIILCINVLHFLDERDVQKIIEKIKTNTLKDGLNIISVFTEDNPSKNFPYLFKKDELKEYYENWEILEYKEFITPLEQHDNFPPHKHAISRIISRRKI